MYVRICIYTYISLAPSLSFFSLDSLFIHIYREKERERERERYIKCIYQGINHAYITCKGLLVRQLPS